MSAAAQPMDVDPESTSAPTFVASPPPQPAGPLREPLAAPGTHKLSKQQSDELRDVAITLDGWCRTCDSTLNTVSTQINKIVKNGHK